MRHLGLAVAVVLATSCAKVTGFETSSTRAGGGAQAATVPAVPVSAGAATEAPSADVTVAAGSSFFSPADDYALDVLDRTGPARGQKPTCPRDAIVAYGGKTVRYDAPASVHGAFVERLARFEKVVEEVGIEVYGRAPKLLHHAGGYMCRTSWRGRMSEHAFGNALDVGGFTFAPISKAELERMRERGVELEPAQRRTFRIGVGETWGAGGKEHAKRFYALLLERVRARDDVFRGMIGPPDPAHTTHLHLDAGPWAFSRYVPPG